MSDFLRLAPSRAKWLPKYTCARRAAGAVFNCSRVRPVQLAAAAAVLTKQAAHIKASVKLVIGGLQELQHIRGEGPRQPIRDIFA